MSEFMTVSDAARQLGASTTFIQRKCKDGSLPCIKVGKTYRVRPADLEALVNVAPETLVRPLGLKATTPGADVLARIDAWLSYLTHVRALAPTTIDLYKVIVRTYLKRMAAIGEEPLSVEVMFDRATVLAVFSKIPPQSFNTKQNTYIALRSFGRFLIEDGRIAVRLVDDLKALKPRRQSEPRRTHLKPGDAHRLFDVILTRPNLPCDNAAFAAIVGCMIFGGLRVSEVCNLRARDVDLDARYINVRYGKGGKDRRVGISNALIGYLREYQAHMAQGERFFVQRDGKSYDRNKVAKRMRLVAQRLGVDITPHGLRRTFATLAAGQGKSVNYLRIALGHSDLATTQAYLRTSEAEVIEAMKGW